MDTGFGARSRATGQRRGLARKDLGCLDQEDLLHCALLLVRVGDESAARDARALLVGLRQH